MRSRSGRSVHDARGRCRQCRAVDRLISSVLQVLPLIAFSNVIACVRSAHPPEFFVAIGRSRCTVWEVKVGVVGVALVLQRIALRTRALVPLVTIRRIKRDAAQLEAQRRLEQCATGRNAAAD